MVAGAVLPGSEYGCPSLQRFATRMSEMCVKSETHITDHSSSQARDTHFTPDSEGRNGFQLIHYGPHLQGVYWRSRMAQDFEVVLRARLLHSL